MPNPVKRYPAKLRQPLTLPLFSGSTKAAESDIAEDITNRVNNPSKHIETIIVKRLPLMKSNRALASTNGPMVNGSFTPILSTIFPIGKEAMTIVINIGI
jgi:hypothetical protein